MMFSFPPAPFQRKGATASSLRSYFVEWLPPWGGPAEAA